MPKIQFANLPSPLRLHLLELQCGLMFGLEYKVGIGLQCAEQESDIEIMIQFLALRF